MSALLDVLASPHAVAVVGVASGGAAASAVVYGASASESGLLARALTGYAAFLTRRSRSIFVRTDARAVVLAQLAVTYLAVLASVALRASAFLAAAALVLFIPAVYLEVKRIRRFHAIEAQADTFVLALANALRATPSIGDAFASLPGVVAEPLKSEIELALKHVRLGATLNDALEMMSKRIGSRVIETALTSVFVGQRVGGELPKVLDTTAATLRELARLDSLVRSKTASGRIQLWVVALAPIAFAAFFEQAQPGYFDPLLRSPIGLMILTAAILFWLFAVGLGRHILRVEV